MRSLPSYQKRIWRRWVIAVRSKLSISWEASTMGTIGSCPILARRSGILFGKSDETEIPTIGTGGESKLIRVKEPLTQSGQDLLGKDGG